MDELAVKIQKTGVRLQLSQIVIAGAITYYYKFKEYGPYSSFKPVEVASTCLFLASKVGDETRKIRDILNCWKEADGTQYDVKLTKAYYNQKERIVECEQVLLRTFVFDVETSHPYVYFLNCCKSLKVSTEIVQCGWSILVDSYICNIRNKYESPILAVSAIYLSLQLLNDRISEEVITEETWWMIFDVSADQLAKCCTDLLAMYPASLYSLAS